jgi:hypothetical protein
MLTCSERCPPLRTLSPRSPPSWRKSGQAQWEAVYRIRIHWVRVRIQHFRLNTHPDPDPVQIQGFDDQKLKKFTAGKNLKFSLIKTCILPYLSVGLHKGRPRNLPSSKENIQHFKTWNFLTIFYFCGSFLSSWIWIHWPDGILIQSGSGSKNTGRRPSGLVNIRVNVKDLIVWGSLFVHKFNVILWFIFTL